MARGRKAQPAALKEAKGNPGKRRVEDAPAPAAEDGKTKSVPAPKHLDKLAREVWEREAPELVRLNFLRASDKNAFARYCEAVVRYWEVTKRLKRGQEVYETESAHGKMLRIHPLFMVQERLAKRLNDLEDRFGLSPAARQQIMQRLAAVAPQLPLGGEDANQKTGQGDQETQQQQAAPGSPIGALSGPPAGHA